MAEELRCVLVFVAGTFEAGTITKFAFTTFGGHFFQAAENFVFFQQAIAVNF